MTDLNQWRIQYPDSSPFDFGTLASAYPLETQVEIGEPNADYQDDVHPNVDGEIMGIDRLRGFNVIFNGRILDDGLQATKWSKPMDLYRELVKVWRADNIRRRPGVYANLINIDRQKVAYGRPRQIAQRNTILRKGVLDFVATFKTIGPNWFDLAEKQATVTVNEGTSVGLDTPITPPFTTIGQTIDDADVDNDGDLETWPVIELYGPGSGWDLDLRQGGVNLWRCSIEGRLAHDEVMTIDTRPWARSATINGNPANGRLRGASITEMWIPVGNFKFRLRVRSDTGTAYAKVYWRDAYAAL